MIVGPTNALARAAVRRLRSGIVPVWEIERLSVAYTSVKRNTNAGLCALRDRSVSKPLFVRGEWGAGKTHLLTHIRAAALLAGIASAKVDLNARSAALNYPQRFYPVIAKTLRAGDDIGLKAILTFALRDRAKRTYLQRGHDFLDLQWPISCLLQDIDEGGFSDLSDHWAWTVLLGGDICSSDYAYRRRQTTDRLGALGQVMRSIGLGGLVLLFDEAETIDQLWNIRSRLSAYDVLGRLCQMTCAWCVFGVTERFDKTIQSDLSRGILDSGSVSENAKWFLQSWNTDRFSETRPPAMDLRTAKQLAHAVENLYETGYAPPANGVADHCLEEWSRNPARNPRRLIRLLVHRFDLARGMPDRPT